MDITSKELKLTKLQQELLNNLHLSNTDEVLSYYPFRYDILNVKSFDDWKEKDKISFEGEVVTLPSSFRKGRLTISRFEVMVEDRLIQVTIFNRPWIRNLKLNQKVTITGAYNGHNKVTAMNYDAKELKDHDLITPVYSLKSGMKQSSIRNTISKVFTNCENEIRDVVPLHYLNKYKLINKRNALKKIHYPKSEEDIKQAIRSLKYEEFLKFFTTIQLMKNLDEDKVIKVPKAFNMNDLKEVIMGLPYELTVGQKKALKEILDDMASNKPLYRLVQGDVGCGKTVVATLAMYASYLSGYQSALLAPTEILAKQHYETIKGILKDKNCKICVLYSGMSNNEKELVNNQIRNGEVDIIIGTHSLIQDTVEFNNLGFVVADEQQRFGVEQRKKSKEKGDNVDLLLMSATPIPRTLASTLFGDMEVSTIDTLPSNRKPTITKYIEENSFRSVKSDVDKLLESGHQLYIICAAVDKSEDYDARNVYETAENIAKYFSDYKVGILHGRMSSEEKEAVMNAFYDNNIQILVSTTVVEVGMNVVNATGMIVYDADRFGLSQLHQLRGRVQRGSEVGQCWLLSDSLEDKVKERLNVLVKSNDGFEISYEDLRLRGPGDILGTRQSGLPSFILGNVVEDTNIITEAQKDALEIINKKNDDNLYFIDYLLYNNDIKDSYRN